MSLTGINGIDQYSTEADIPAASNGAAIIQCISTNELWLSNGTSVERVGSQMGGTTKSNYAFNGTINAGSGKYNLYMSGTANNYLAGDLGIGSATFSDGSSILRIGATRYAGTSGGVAIYCDTNIPATSTGSFTLYIAKGVTTAGGGLTSLFSYQVSQGTFGSSVTNQYGFNVDGSLTGATNNYAFTGNIAAGTGRYNLYMSGTAANYLAGDLQLAKTVTASGTTGAQTINKTTGTVNFAAAATSLVVTNSLVTANSIIIATVGTNDTTMKSVQVVAGSGSFTIYANAAATAETRVNFLITN